MHLPLQATILRQATVVAGRLLANISVLASHLLHIMPRFGFPERVPACITRCVETEFGQRFDCSCCCTEHEWMHYLYCPMLEQPLRQHHQLGIECRWVQCSKAGLIEMTRVQKVPAFLCSEAGSIPGIVQKLGRDSKFVSDIAISTLDIIDRSFRNNNKCTTAGSACLEIFTAFFWIKPARELA